MKTRFILTTTAILIAVMFTINGCDNNNSNTNNDHNDTIVTEGSAYGSLIDDTMKSLLKSVGLKALNEVMGLILEYLGWGDSGDSQEVKTLDEMNGKLDEIVSELGLIDTELQELMVQMVITEEEIIANTNDPTDAITQINTFQSELLQEAEGKKPGEGDKKWIKSFADTVQNNFQIENDVNTIFDAIKPPTVVKAPVLNNFTDLLLNRYHVNKGSLKDVYDSVELYTSQLVYNQLKGVNLVVEAKHINDDNASVLRYLQDYQENILKEEIGIPGNGVSFIYNIWRIALLNMDIYPNDGSSFFSQDIQDILKSAEFYKLQTLGEEKFGLQVLLFTTQDVASPGALRAIKDGQITSLYCEQLDAEIQGKPYDFWVGGSHVKGSSLYNVTECRPYSPVEVGTYQITFDSMNAPTIAEATVKKYDENYTPTTDGNITYGLATTLYRSEINHYTESSPNWTLHKNLSKYSHLSGSANDWAITLVIDDPDHLDVEITSDAELQGHFTYAGTEDQTITVSYNAKYYLHASGKDCEVCDSGTVAKAGYKTGVYNGTEHKEECSWTNTINVKTGEDTAGFHYPAHNCSFTAKPGNNYYVYFKMDAYADHNDDAGPYAKSELDKVSQVHLKFSN